MRHNLSSDDGFTILELLSVILILAILILVGFAFFGAQTEVAQNHQAQSIVHYAHEIAKLEWEENSNAYPPTAALIADMALEDSTYQYRASLPETSYSIDPHDVSVLVDENAQMITLCSRSVTHKVFCARWDERARMLAPDYTQQASTDPLLGPGVAHALEVPSGRNKQDIAFSQGRGALAEQDAIAALPTREAVQSCGAGPGNTGFPSWDSSYVCPPTPQEEAPHVVITSGPEEETASRNALITYSAGGPVSWIECHLDGVITSCFDEAATFTNLSNGGHVFQVSVHGPGGSDQDSHEWSVISPPNDRVELDGVGDYASTPYPSNLSNGWNRFEVGAWVKVDQLPSSGTIATIASHGIPGGSKHETGWHFSIDASGKLLFGGWGSNKKWVQTSSACAPTAPSLTPGAWNYVNAQWEPGGNVNVYLNNTRVGCAEQKNNPASRAGGNLYVGSQLVADNGAFNQALGDEVGMFLGGQISTIRMTRGGGPSYVVNPGPTNSTPPPRLFSPAENGRPATFLYDFEDDYSDSQGVFPNLSPHGDTRLVNQ